MATIEEIPLDNQETAQDIPETVEETQDNQEETVAEPPAPKKKGRPPGAKNKPKAPPPKASPPKASAPKPKPKRKPVIEEEEYEESSEEDEPQRRVPQVDRHQLASEVLGLLQQQRYNQANARRNHYASWFNNM